MDNIERFGFDLGDGESCLTKLDAGGVPRVLELGGARSILTAIGDDEGGGTLIGEQARLRSVGGLRARFKRGFLDDPESSTLIGRFARAVLAALISEGKLRSAGEAEFYVGVPSGWDRAARERYKAVFEGAGYKNVSVISESRAAFLYARESGELRASPDSLKKPTLIVDSGSSTTDFTFVSGMSERALTSDFGEARLGAGLIDAALLRVNIERSRDRERLEEAIEASPRYEARLDVEARKVKETYFNMLAHGGAGAGALDGEASSSVKVYYRLPPATLNITCSDEDMRRALEAPQDALGGESFVSALRRALISASAKLLATPPETILLTGGASRMPFIADEVRNAFPEATILKGLEPEFAIGRGLGYALRVDVATRAFMDDVRELLDSGELERAIEARLPELYARLGRALSEYMTDGLALPAFDAWKRGEIATIDGISERLASDMRAAADEGKLREAAAREAAKWLAELRDALERLTDPICAKHGLPPEALRIPAAVPLELQLPGADLSRAFGLGAFSAVVDVISGALVAALVGGGGIAAIAGPMGLAIGFAIGALAGHLGARALKGKISAMELPVYLRALFARAKFRAELDKRSSETAAEIASRIASLDAQLASDTARSVGDQLRALSDRARLLIS